MSGTVIAFLRAALRAKRAFQAKAADHLVGPRRGAERIPTLRRTAVKSASVCGALTCSTQPGPRSAFAAKADKKNLYVAWRVDSGQPLRNAGDEPQLLFKTGDSVDLQIGTDPAADPHRTQPAPGDQRLLISLFKGQPIGVLYRHRVPDTPGAERIGFSSPWRTEYVDRIERLDPANIGIARTKTGYAVEAVVPLELLGLKLQPGNRYMIDFGILSADSGGSVTVTRTYWANKATGLVNDVPGEITLHPGLWGTVQFAE